MAKMALLASISIILCSCLDIDNPKYDEYRNAKNLQGRIRAEPSYRHNVYIDSVLREDGYFLMTFVRGELYYIKISNRGAENEYGLMDVQDLENKLSDVFSSTATIHAVYVQREDSLRLDCNRRLFEFFYSNECHVMKIVDRFRGESVSSDGM
jgi:hypothetical protein